MDEPRQMPYELPVCVIIEFKENTFAEDTRWRTDLDKIYIPIAPVIICCEEYCCSVTYILLRVCMVIAIHKSQGMSIGPGNLLGCVIFYLPEKEERTNHGSKVGAFSRVTDILTLVICDTIRKLTIETLNKIGNGNHESKRKALIIY